MIISFLHIGHFLVRINALLFFLCSLPGTTMATTITCPSPQKLTGTFITSVEKGFTPNRLALKVVHGGSYQLSLTSYWAPVPHDDGTRGTIGEFEGNLLLPKPWRCVASFSTQDNDCHLLLRFVGNQTVFVESSGQCEIYHGANAYPQGRYTKQ